LLVRKSIDIKGRLSEHSDINNKKYSLKHWEDSGEIRKKEAEKFHNYLPIPFIEKSIITIRYNPKEATVEYWCNNKQINYVIEIHSKRPYSFKFFVKFFNCSVRFLTYVHAKILEDLKKTYSSKIIYWKI
jgi:hypothetical protein